MATWERNPKPPAWSAAEPAAAATHDSAGQITLPVSRAFLVQLAADCEPTDHAVRGRVEHVRSGEATHFQSLPELEAFMLDVLRQGGKATR